MKGVIEFGFVGGRAVNAPANPVLPRGPLVLIPRRVGLQVGRRYVAECEVVGKQQGHQRDRRGRDENGKRFTRVAKA